jgi:predicted DNA-binding transcriptional regulator YafY
VDLTDRVFELHGILTAARAPVSRSELQERLECSRATVARIIGQMRDYLGAPIEYDRRACGYRFAKTDGGPYELPGLWFNPSELHALLAAHHLLASAQPGLLEADLAPLTGRIERLLAARGIERGEVGKRVRILRMTARRLAPEPFRTVAGAVLARRRLRLHYHGRARDETTERHLSPQRLTHYRDNWYLDAWDHGRSGLRSFSVDRIRRARALETEAKEIPAARLDEHFASAYGIFAGKPKHTAVLQFTPESARWVADEVWHPEQKGYFDGGRYLLEIPYGDSRELTRDILKHGPDVTVVAPESLRNEVRRRIEEALSGYEGSPSLASARGIRRGA